MAIRGEYLGTLGVLIVTVGSLFPGPPSGQSYIYFYIYVYWKPFIHITTSHSNPLIHRPILVFSLSAVLQMFTSLISPPVCNQPPISTALEALPLDAHALPPTVHYDSTCRGSDSPGLAHPACLHADILLHRPGPQHPTPGCPSYVEAFLTLLSQASCQTFTGRLTAYF